MEKRCKNCRHYIQHYAYQPDVPYLDSDHGYIAVNAGHCIYPHVKLRKPNEHCNIFAGRDEP